MNELPLLIAEVQAAVEGRPPASGVWRKELSPGRRKWLAGVSNNIPRLAAAVEAAVEPKRSADWWADLLEEEWGAGGYWDAQEAGGRTYGGVTWAAELAAYGILRRVLPAHRASGLLARSLTRRAAWYALTGVPMVYRHGGRGQRVYAGMGSLTTGGRSNHFAAHAADPVMHRVLTRQRPPLELHSTEVSPALLGAIMRAGGEGWSGVADDVASDLRVLVATEGTDFELVGRAVALLGPARTLAPLFIRRYADRTLACGVSWNPSANTSCAFLVASTSPVLPLDLDNGVVYLHPYGEHQRVRGGTPLGGKILGRGHTWWEGNVFACANLTREEEQRRGGPRWELRHELPPDSTIAWELRTSPDAPPALTVGGRLVTPPPRPPERPVEPPPPVRPEPSPQPGPPIPAEGRHATFRIPGATVVVNIKPGHVWEGRRWKPDGGEWQDFR